MNTKNTLLTVLRWILFLPASVLGSWLIYIITLWINRAGESVWTMQNTIWYYVADVIASLFMGVAFVGIGTFVAPKHNRVVLIGLLCLLCLISGASIFANIMNGFQLMPLISALCTIAGGGVFARYYFVNEEGD